MSFYRKIKYYLVHTLKFTNAEAEQMIREGQVEIDGTKITGNQILKNDSEIKINGKVVRAAKQCVYIKFYKPRGYESTLSKNIENNLAVFFEEFSGLSIAGRLDKASEGLMLLSNDGKWAENITNPKFEKEKEYLVELDREPDADFIKSFSGGVNIGYHVTKPCQCILSGGHSVKVTLKEGKNRQIRKMCKTLGYNVIKLKRTRIDQFKLNNLKPGEWELVKF